MTFIHTIASIYGGCLIVFVLLMLWLWLSPPQPGEPSWDKPWEQQR